MGISNSEHITRIGLFYSRATKVKAKMLLKKKNVTLWLTEGKTKKIIHKYIRTNQNHIYNQLLGICGVPSITPEMSFVW
jgi:hypothetical protein